MAQDFRKLVVWQKSIELTVLIYKITQSFPRHEIYGLSSQMRRASVSIASNIAEGRGRINSSEFRQFLGIARGSACELLTQIHVARALAIDTTTSLDEAESLANEVSKMLLRFIQKLSSPVGSTFAASHSRSQNPTRLQAMGYRLQARREEGK